MLYDCVDPHEHPVRLTVEDDLRRNRLTVFFRLLLALPHFIWFFLWTIAALLGSILNWFATLVLGCPPGWLHRFLCAYIRYSVHLGAYLYLAANPYPGFVGERARTRSRSSCRPNRSRRRAGRR